MKKECSAEEARSKAEAYCSLTERCTDDVLRKLEQWGAPSGASDAIVEYLKKERYIDEQRYANAFVRDKYRFNQWGRIKIAQALRMKHVASEYIYAALDEIDEEEYNDNQALFNGKVDIKNLNVDLAGVYGRGYAGVIGGTIYGSLDNCHVTNSGVEGYFWQAGGLVGQYCGGSITNCSVASTHVNSYSAVGALVGLIGDTTNGVTCLFDNCTVNGCEVRASGSLGEYYDNSFGVVAGWVTEGKTVYISECDFQNNIYVTDRTANTTAELPICGKYAEGSVIIE